MNQELLENVKTLVKVSESISETYSKMSLLEKECKKETDEYKSLVECLKSTIMLENSIVSRIPQDLRIIKELEQEISKFSDYHESVPIENLIIQNNKPQLSIARIFLRLKESAKRNTKSSLESLISKIIPSEILRQTEVYTSDESLLNYTQIAETVLSIQRDMSTILYKLLEERISKETDTNLRNILIDYKYNLILLDSKLEHNLIAASFQSLENYYLESNLTASLFKMSNEDLIESKEKCSKDLVEYQIKKILTYSDHDYTSNIAYSEIIFRSLLLRSGLQFITPENQIDLSSDVFEFVETEHYLSEFPNDEKSIDLIRKSFKAVKTDLEGISKISLKIKG